jgi:hypothetical protein
MYIYIIIYAYIDSIPRSPHCHLATGGPSRDAMDLAMAPQEDEDPEIVREKARRARSLRARSWHNEGKFEVQNGANIGKNPENHGKMVIDHVNHIFFCG